MRNDPEPTSSGAVPRAGGAFARVAAPTGDRLALRLGLALTLFLLLGARPCQAGEPARSCLRLDTAAGFITIELDAAAAPEAVAALRRQAGALEGLAFEFARPHVEIRLAPRDPDDRVAVEIDAAALGLDRQRIADAGEAMNVLQFELLPAAQRAPAPGREGEGAGAAPATPLLEQWRERFEKDYDPSFLVGTTRQQILEAEGYRFRPGLASRPPTRGAVALVPASPTRARLALSILLADLPARLGTWMVVGRLLDGLDVAEAISIRPMADLRRDDTRPLDPVVVRHSELLAACPSEPEGERP